MVVDGTGDLSALGVMGTGVDVLLSFLCVVGKTVVLLEMLLLFPLSGGTETGPKYICIYIVSTANYG